MFPSELKQPLVFADRKNDRLGPVPKEYDETAGGTGT